MIDRKSAEKTLQESDKDDAGGRSSADAIVQPPQAGSPEVSAAHEPAGTHPTTAEEQMALFEKELKENDWGHQPC